MPQYVAIDGEQVSREWYAVLRDMRAAGVTFNVNEGHRTMARQQYFWNLYQSGQGNLAARPSPFAPHIRTGRIDHAIDFGNDAAVFPWLTSKGLNPRRTVRNESWHIEVAASALRAYKRRVDPLKALTKPERVMASRLLHHRRKMNAEAKTGKGARYKAQLRFVRFWKARVENQMRRLRTDSTRSGWGGWKKSNRGGRYQTLKRVLATTTGRGRFA